MKRFLLIALFFAAPLLVAAADAPLRVFIRSGPKSHGPGAHDYPRFLREWVPMLNDRGARATGADAFPTRAQLEQTDVLILHAQEAGNISAAEDRRNLDEFLKRGGGLVAIHAGVVSRNPEWFKGIVGGTWRQGTTKWLEGPMHLYFADRDSPITKDCSNWAMNDEIYYDLDLLPQARVLATAYTPKAAGARNDASQKRADELTGGGKKVSIYDIQPQMWMYERTIEGATSPYRAFVSIPGHLYENFNRPNYRAILLRGIAWAGRHANVDVLCRPDELGDNLRYVEGGPTRPDLAAAKIEVHPEFNLSLVAAEPLIHKAIAMDWDEKGRLWVAETPEYPNGRRVPNTAPWKDSGSLYPQRHDREPEDRISILSDTNGDGVMDRKHVFADKLELVTGFVFHRNGVVACSAPDIWFLEDTNGDQVADQRTKLYTGLGTTDTHAVINNLRWGLDGWIYATHGYSRGNVTSADGTKTFGPDGSGVVRFKPDGSAFEQYSSRNGNTWGLDITWDGQVFWTQPTSGTVFFHTVLPEYVLAKGKIAGTTSANGMITREKSYPLMTWTEQAYVQIDQVGQFTAASGCAVYDGGAWPEKWRYSYFTGEPTINLVHHQFVRPAGVTYTTEKEKGREQTEFIRSRDLWFRPIETRVGPDGALYVIDFYNQAVIHNDTRGPQHGPANAAIRPDRDHFFSRIWKVQHKDAKKLEVPVLHRTDIAGLIRAIETSPNAQVKQTAWRLAQENHASNPRVVQLKRPMGSKALQVFEQASHAARTDDRRQWLTRFAEADDAWTKSAVVAAASGHATEFLTDALVHEKSASLAPFATALFSGNAATDAAQLVRACAAAPVTAAELKITILRGLGQGGGSAPAVDNALAAALERLLQEPRTAAAVLPLIGQWDKSGALAGRANRRGRELLREVSDSRISDERRAEIAMSLLGISSLRVETLKGIATILAAPGTTEGLSGRLITALGDDAGPDVAAVLVDVLARTNSAVALDQLVKRAESALALLVAIKDGRVNPAKLGPANLSRLRTHPSRQVARQAAALLETLNPQTKQKNELIARLTAEVEKPGDPAKGRTLFTAACSACHKFGDLGLSDVGPPLHGMGAHGPSELLVHIVDPNREVDASFFQWNVTTKKGEIHSGIVASENAASMTLRHAGGEIEIRKDDIASRENTRRSLMPEGLEGLGSEGLRDLLAFMCGADQKFRVLDLRDAYTADSRRGAFRREDERDETITLHKFGNVTVAGVPFFVMDPAKAPNGMNFIALKGGPGRNNVSEQFPRHVEINTRMTTASLHFLGGVGGWAWPYGGDAGRGRPALKVIVTFADGTTEEHVLKNGEHFADYIGRANVPQSVDAGDFTKRGQLRYFALNLGRRGALAKVALESFDNDIVPCTVAITAGAEPASAAVAAIASEPTRAGLRAANSVVGVGERAVMAQASRSASASPGAATAAAAQSAAAEGPKEGGRGDAPLPDPTAIRWESGKTKVLIVTGGSSHNFAKFFGETDTATLKAAGFSVNYTEDRDQAATALREADVAVISVNRKFFDTPQYRRAVFDFAAAGKGIIMLHPGTWYGFPQWPELNAKIVGGGARGHDKIASYTVNALRPEHPILKGVPASFEVEDELYYINAEPDKIPPGTSPITVLAETSPSLRFKQPHPAVWITGHEKARIVGITIGHDQRVHDMDAYKTLLANAVKWAGGK
ncbi:MAG: ThuA domain-containing protein [Opitutaceae bacterium]|nr:ThuA domain-containing protein [Opitutaceae bacterium]